MPTIDELKAQLKELKKTHKEIRVTGLKKAELEALVKKYTEKKADTPAVKKPAEKSTDAEYIYLYSSPAGSMIWVSTEPFTKKSIDHYNIKLVLKKKVKNVDYAWSYISYGEVSTTDGVDFYDYSDKTLEESKKRVQSYKD